VTLNLNLAILCLGFVASSTLAADASEPKFIRDGMSEGEVVMKIGRPDSESVDTGGGSKVTVKRWMYYPTSSGPQTLTTLTIREGKVVEVDRQVSRCPGCAASAARLTFAARYD
jgi:hypothetical protein